MATSSIFTNVKITDPEKGKAFIEALLASENDPPFEPTMPVPPTITDLDEIRRIMKYVPVNNKEETILSYKTNGNNDYKGSAYEITKRVKIR